MSTPTPKTLLFILETLDWTGHVELPRHDMSWLASSLAAKLSPDKHMCDIWAQDMQTCQAWRYVSRRSLWQQDLTAFWAQVAIAALLSHNCFCGNRTMFSCLDLCEIECCVPF